MMRLLITEYEEALDEFAIHNSQFTINDNSEFRIPNSEFSIATGVAAGRFLTNILKTAAGMCDRINGKVFTVRNDYFGDSVTVSGLVTGGDLISQLRGRALGDRLLIPQNMLRSGDEVFLDDVSVSDVSKALGVPVRVVRQDGADLFRAIIETSG